MTTTATEKAVERADWRATRFLSRPIVAAVIVVRRDEEPALRGFDVPVTRAA